MAIPVGFLLNNLKQLVVYHYNLISKAKAEFENLQNDLMRLKDALKDASSKSKKEESFKSWERRIREVMYDVEDTIDTHIIQMWKDTDKNPTYRILPSPSLAKLVNSKRAKVQHLLAQLPTGDVPHTNADDTRFIRQPRRENKIVGFDQEAECLITELRKESDRLKVISIVGMPGLGKTTMAWKIFDDPKIKYAYHTRIWVNITNDVDIKTVLLTIRRKFKKDEPDMTVEQLTDDVRLLLKTAKFLIVMDDVWTNIAWFQIENFLPMDNKHGRILITSRHKNVAAHAFHHTLKFLTDEESWELLQYEVSGNQGNVGEDMVQVGKVIAKRCVGLPLSIIVIGGILADKRSMAEWEQVSQSIHKYLNDAGDQRLKKIISLSYAQLPYELQGCFLYLGVFPEDAKIPAKKLILLWIAEGLIQEQDTSGKNLEEVARDKLDELIYRNLVMLDKVNLNGEAQICRVHDTIREFCKNEAAFDKQNLYQEVVHQQGLFQPTVENIERSCRRLCIHSHVYEFLLKRPKALKARSFLSFSKKAISLEKSEMKCFTDAFSVLRVMDAENIKFPIFPVKLKGLFFLRYLTLAVAGDSVKSLPKVIYELKNLQTFLLDINSRTIKITAEVWKMKQLRHFKTKASIEMSVREEVKGDGGENLQRLSRLSPGSCTEHVLKQAKNLIALGVQGDLSTLKFKCLGTLGLLKKLKLVHDVYNTSGSDQPWNMPQPEKFPPKLRILVLAGTCLDWAHMSTLGKLIHLEILKLKDNAFQGTCWKTSGGGFACLELLHIERADLMSWETMDDAFPVLRRLSLKHCNKLMAVPLKLGKKLEMLCMERVNPTAVESAKKIKEERLASGQQDFKLDIAPTDDE